MNQRGTITTSIVCVAVLAFGIFIWPTIYKYEKIKVGNSELLVKINRLNGYTERFIKGTWVSEDKKSTDTKETMSEKNIVILPEEELNRIHYDGAYSSFSPNYYFGELSNNTVNWIITNIVVKVIKRNQNGDIISENIYKSTLDSPLEPSKSADVGFNAAGISEYNTAESQLLEACGYQTNNTK